MNVFIFNGISKKVVHFLVWQTIIKTKIIITVEVNKVLELFNFNKT